jgi:uncharacterized membrane protein
VVSITRAGPDKKEHRTMARTLPWLASLTAFLALDAVWLGLAGPSLYGGVLGGLMLDGFRIVPAALFYPLQITGIAVFVLPRARLAAVAAHGALFGLCTYGTYDLTNEAVLRVWTWQLTAIDMTWGTCVTAAASVTGALVRRRIANRPPATPETPSAPRR